MDIYTLDRGFIRQDLIDDDKMSSIWTERYYGDGDFTLNVPATSDMILKLPKGVLMECEGSDQPMILETREIKDGVLKGTGITLTQWLNERIIRAEADHSVKEWHLSGMQAATTLAHIVEKMCVAGSNFLDGTVAIGIPAMQTALFAIPGLQIGSYSDSGPNIDVSVPFGPVYDGLNPIATTYEIGMKITLDEANEFGYIISFVPYRGINRSSDQSDFPTVQFSPAMDSFINITDLDSIADYKNSVYMFGPGAPELSIGPGHAGPGGTGFDLRVFQGWADDITSETVGASSSTFLSVLNQRAANELTNHKAVALVDGQIVQVEDAVFGEDFFLGDVVDVEGNTGILQKARITEYIRSQDNTGETAYPTLEMID